MICKCQTLDEFMMHCDWAQKNIQPFESETHTFYIRKCGLAQSQSIFREMLARNIRITRTINWNGVLMLSFSCAGLASNIEQPMNEDFPIGP